MKPHPTGQYLGQCWHFRGAGGERGPEGRGIGPSLRPGALNVATVAARGIGHPNVKVALAALAGQVRSGYYSAEVEDRESHL